jgi:hypothetical protein
MEDSVLKGLVQQLGKSGMAYADIDDEGVYFGSVKEKMIMGKRFDAFREFGEGDSIEVTVDEWLGLGKGGGLLRQEDQDEG